jgi:hypothetical protein
LLSLCVSTISDTIGNGTKTFTFPPSLFINTNLHNYVVRIKREMRANGQHMFLITYTLVHLKGECTDHSINSHFRTIEACLEHTKNVMMNKDIWTRDHMGRLVHIGNVGQTEHFDSKPFTAYFSC